MIFIVFLLYTGTLWARKRLRITHARVPGLNGYIDTLDIHVYIPTNLFKIITYEKSRRLGDVMTLIWNMFGCPIGH